MVSFYTTSKGWSEVYPFYFWKLYSQPAGWAYKYDDLRVYAKNKNDHEWVRIPNEYRNTFNKDETLYFLRHIVPRLQGEQTEEERIKDLNKLGVFCDFLVPEYEQHKIVLEQYNPLEVINNPTQYDTTTVVEIP